MAGVSAGAQGGAFAAEGWTVTGDEDTIWYRIPATLPSGRVEVTVTGLSTATNLTGEGHNPITIYGVTDADEPSPYIPYFRSNDFKVMVFVFGTGETSRGPGASKLELRLCPVGPPGHHETCPTECSETVDSQYLDGAVTTPLPWDPGRRYRLRISWSPGVITYDRGESPVTISYPGAYAPAELVVRIGSSRHRVGTGNRMPAGARFSDLLVVGTRGSVGSCGSVTPPPDGGMDMGRLGCLQALSLTPTDASGSSTVLRAVYRHCEGASAFRILQLSVADMISPTTPSVGGFYEAGRFGLGGQSCAPGESTFIDLAPYGRIDCSRSTALLTGEQATVDWGLEFNVAAFAGTHGVFVDAKGGTGDPEPRLGWTRMGQFTVTDTGGPPPPPPVDASTEPAVDRHDPDPVMMPGTPATGATSGCACQIGAAPSLHEWTLQAFALALCVARRALRL